MEREVENAVGRLALEHGRVHVAGGFTDGLVRATVPNGRRSYINEDGVIVKTDLNQSVDWTRRV